MLDVCQSNSLAQAGRFLGSGRDAVRAAWTLELQGADEELAAERGADRHRSAVDLEHQGSVGRPVPDQRIGTGPKAVLIEIDERRGVELDLLRHPLQTQTLAGRGVLELGE